MKYVSRVELVRAAILRKAVFSFLGSCIVCAVVSAPASAAEPTSGSLSQALAKHAHLAEPQAKEMSEAVTSAIRAELKSGNTVELSSLGRFYVQQRELKPRAGSKAAASSNGVPRTRRYARFTPATELRTELNADQASPPEIGGQRPKALHPGA